MAAAAEVERRGKLMERDKTGMAAALNAIRKVAIGYGWIPNGELGSYTAAGCGEGEELTEEVLREEVGRCLDEIRATAVQALSESGDRVNAMFVPDRDCLDAALKRVAELEAELAVLTEFADACAQNRPHDTEEVPIDCATCNARRALGMPAEDHMLLHTEGDYVAPGEVPTNPQFCDVIVSGRPCGMDHHAQKMLSDKDYEEAKRIATRRAGRVEP